MFSSLILAGALDLSARAQPILLIPTTSPARIAAEIRQQAPYPNRFLASDGTMVLRGTLEIAVGAIPQLERGAFVHQLQLVLRELAPASARVNARAADAVTVREIGAGAIDWEAYDFSRESTLDLTTVMRTYDPRRNDLGQLLSHFLGIGQVVVGTPGRQSALSGVIRVDLGADAPEERERRALWFVDQLEDLTRFEVGRAAIYIPDPYGGHEGFDRILARGHQLDRMKLALGAFSRLSSEIARARRPFSKVCQALLRGET